jgi:membrane associated rhomboid family serine protease
MSENNMSEVFLNDYVLLKSYFEAKNYKKIDADNEQIALFTLYQKSSYYIINLVHLPQKHTFDIQRYEFYMDNLSHQFSQYNTDRVIMLTIFVGDWNRSLYDYFNKRPNIEAKTIEVTWFVSSDTRELDIPDQQLNSVMGIEKRIRKLLKNKKQTYYAIEKQTQTQHITLVIGLINVIVWMLMEMYGSSTDANTLMRFGAIHVEYIIRTQQYWRFVSAMFIHIGGMHLLFNLFGLYIFGSRLEKYISARHFAMIYLGAGVFGSILSFGYHLFTQTEVIAAGASGAIYGLIGSALVLSKVMNRSMDGINDYIIWLFFIYGIVYSVVSPNVDLFAHVGGFVGGVAISIPIVRLRLKEIGGTEDEAR